MKRLEKYIDVVDMVLTEHNKKSCATTMMIKQNRKQHQETTVRKTHMENHAAMVKNIAKRLGLNEKVAEVMAKHHDIAHTFLGHSGEWWLSNIKENLGIGYYTHSALGARKLIYEKDVYSEIMEKIKFQNPNVSNKQLNRFEQSLWLIFDAIMCHNGEKADKEIIPETTKTQKGFKKELLQCHTKKKFDKEVMPATPEGCLMRICDTNSYAVSDLLDGIREGFIPGLTEKHISVLQQIGITKEEIKLANAKKDYHLVASKIREIFSQDVVENSTKKVMKMSEEMTKLKYELIHLNNEYTVKYVVTTEDYETCTKGLNCLTTKFSDLILEADLFDRLPNANTDLSINAQLEEKYPEPEYQEFIRYIGKMNPKHYRFIKTQVREATKESTREEMETAREVVRGQRPNQVDPEMWQRANRINGYIGYYSNRLMGKQPYTQEEEIKDIEQIMQLAYSNRKNPNYLNEKQRIAAEISTRYLSTLNDPEFMHLLKISKLITPEQEKSMTRRYEDVNLEEEVYHQKEWKEIRQKQEEVAKQ